MHAYVYNPFVPAVYIQEVHLCVAMLRELPKFANYGFINIGQLEHNISVLSALCYTPE